MSLIPTIIKQLKDLITQLADNHFGRKITMWKADTSFVRFCQTSIQDAVLCGAELKRVFDIQSVAQANSTWLSRR